MKSNLMAKDNSLRQEFLKKLSYSVVHFRFLNRWLVLLIDLLIATVAAFISYVVAAYLTDSFYFIKIAWNAALLSLFTSLVAFLLTGTYKGILRYTTSQEIWLLCSATIVKMAIEVPLILLLRKHMGFSANISNAKILLIEFLNLGTTLAFLSFSRAFLVALFKFSTKIQLTGGDYKLGSANVLTDYNLSTAADVTPSNKGVDVSLGKLAINLAIARNTAHVGSDLEFSIPTSKNTVTLRDPQNLATCNIKFPPPTQTCGHPVPAPRQNGRPPYGHVRKNSRCCNPDSTRFCG